MTGVQTCALPISEPLRCDDRLIHGQCIVKVLNDYKIDYIILVDAFTASNPVMSNIYKMSVPPNVHLDVASAQSAIALIEQAEKSSERTLVLVKDPIIALELQKNCTVLPKALNIGPMSNRKGTKKATYFSYLLDSEAAACEELHAMGIRVYFQQVPGEKEMEWKEAF